MLNRLGKAVVMAAEEETSEIIRRRLFDWHGIPDEGRKVAAAYAEWMQANRELLPKWFPVDSAREAIEATYPFHPMALVRIREEMADPSAIPTDARCPAASGAVGFGGVPKRIQGRFRRSADRPRHGAS